MICHTLKMLRYAIGATAFGSLGYLCYTKYVRHLQSKKTKTSSEESTPSLDGREGLSWMLLTDLEPDDMVAMGVLAARLDSPSYLVVGEGSADLKGARALTYAKHLGWNETLVVKGLPSDKAFEGEEVLVEHSASLPKEVCSLKPDHFTQTDTFICLKPPRELCAHYMAAPDDFRGKRLILYGSFNLRTIVEKEGWEAVSWIFDESSPFREVILYESYKAIPDAPSTSANKDNCPEFWTALDGSIKDDIDDFDKDLCACLATWDAAILKDCVDTMEECEAGSYGDPASEEVKARYSRNKTCRDQVMPHQGRQFVMADCVLATVFDNPAFAPNKTPIKVTYEAPYLVKTPVDDDGSTKVYTYQGMAWEDVCHHMTSMFFA